MGRVVRKGLYGAVSAACGSSTLRRERAHARHQLSVKKATTSNQKIQAKFDIFSSNSLSDISLHFPTQPKGQGFRPAVRLSVVLGPFTSVRVSDRFGPDSGCMIFT